MYHLHPTLAADTFYLGRLTLCDVLLMNNSSYPWLILVPRRAAIREIYELDPDDQALFSQESNEAAQKLAAYTKADKMNVAALGNMVPQLHLHIIARYTTDAAWPQPIWLNPAPTPYDPEKKQQLITALRTLLGIQES